MHDTWHCVMQLKKPAFHTSACDHVLCRISCLLFCRKNNFSSEMPSTNGSPHTKFEHNLALMENTLHSLLLYFQLQVVWLMKSLKLSIYSICVPGVSGFNNATIIGMAYGLIFLPLGLYIILLVYIRRAYFIVCLSNNCNSSRQR